jgi:hypothetical protein
LQSKRPGIAGDPPEPPAPTEVAPKPPKPRPPLPSPLVMLELAAPPVPVVVAPPAPVALPLAFELAWSTTTEPHDAAIAAAKHPIAAPVHW